ncbi:MAG: C10 family peptidase [Prevotella sp.]|nr:C10 family peptidase [Prevotella sp.]
MTLGLFVALPAWSGPRTFEQAQKIAETQATRLGLTVDRKAMARAKAINGVVDGVRKVANYYVFPNGTDKGFTIVSGDDSMPDIVGYSASGTYDESMVPEAMTYFLKEYSNMVEAVKAGDGKAQRTLEERRGVTVAPAVSPLVNVHWGQGTPFNNLCPYYATGKRSVTGCVATAMAQVMAYWKYPKELKADIPSYVTTTNNISVRGETGGQAYDWDNMRTEYKSAYTTAEADAVAKLMLHCGKAVEMDYGASSGAVVTHKKLATYFGYDKDLMLTVSRSSFSLSEWITLIDNELKAGRPILYSGRSSDAGHLFVCDGSDGEGLYHINWGWNGNQDGYFDITILNPDKGGIGSGNAEDGYSKDCMMIIGMQPDNGIVDEPLVNLPLVQAYKYNRDGYKSSFTITQGVRQNASGSFQLTIGDAFFSNTDDTFSGKLAYGVSDGKGGYTPIAQIDSKVQLGGLFFTTKVYWSPAPGTYTIYALYCASGENTWHKCAYANGLAPYKVTATDTQLSMTKSMLSATLKPVGELHAYDDGIFEVTLTNGDEDDYVGEVAFWLSDTEDESAGEKTTTLDIVVGAHSTITRQITVSSFQFLGEGDAYVWLRDASGATISPMQKVTVGKAAKPVLVLASVETNVTPGEYETERAFYGTDKVKAPKVNDDFVRVRMGFTNIGAEGEVRYFISASNPASSQRYWKGYKTVNVPNDGSVTYIEETWSPSETGFAFMQCSLSMSYMDSDDSPVRFVSMANYMYKLELADGSGRYFQVPANMQFVYVAGKTVGIDNVEAGHGVTVRSGEGEVIILADKTEGIAIYGVDGRKVKDVVAQAGIALHVSVPSGIYIVKGIKVLVR